MNWDSEIIKVILFTQAPLPDVAELWTKIAGASPDNVQKKGLPLPLLGTAAGTWNDYSLSVTFQLGRVEVAITAVDPDPAGPMPSPVIRFNEIDAAVAEVRSIARWLYKGLGVTRITAANQLVKDVSSEEAGVDLLNKELPNLTLPSDSDSILFQLNRKREIESGSVVNRLLKWGVARIGVVGVGIDASGARLVPYPQQEQSIRAFMHVDVNNRPSPTPLDDNEAARLTEYVWDQEAELRKGGWSAL